MKRNLTLGVFSASFFFSVKSTDSSMFKMSISTRALHYGNFAIKHRLYKKKYNNTTTLCKRKSLLLVVVVWLLVRSPSFIRSLVTLLWYPALSRTSTLQESSSLQVVDWSDWWLVAGGQLTLDTHGRWCVVRWCTVE